jgi:hypothetical protein
MNGNLTIDFRPERQSMPRILQAIGTAGLDLYGLHLIPSAPDRWTLHLDLGAADLDGLERELRSYGEIIEVIHKTAACAVR